MTWRLQFSSITTLSFIACFDHTCDALHDLVAFVQFKKREKHPWRSVNFSKGAAFPLDALRGPGDG